MISLEKKTHHWVNKNIISMAQREQILEQEHIARKPFVFFSFIWLSIFLIILGLSSVIGSFWQSIPESVKLGVATVLLFSSLIFSALAIKKEKQKIAEIALCIAFFMIGGGIGLVAQIFNLPVNGSTGLFLWLFLSFGIVLLSKHRLLAFLWIPLFFGGVIGYMKLELLLLFFEQSPLFATILLGGILICLIYLSHFFTDKFAVSLYHWSVFLYFPVVFLGDIAMREVYQGFLISLVCLGLLLFFAVTARRTLLFNVTGFFIILRILLFYFQNIHHLYHIGIAFSLAGIGLLGCIGIWIFLKKKHII